MRLSENYRLQRSVKRLDLITEGLDDLIPTPFALTPEGVIDYLFYELIYDQDLFQRNAEVTSIEVREERHGILIEVNTIEDLSFLEVPFLGEKSPFFKGGSSLLIDPFGKVIEEEDLSYTSLTREQYESAYQEVRKVRGYAPLVTIR